MRESKFSPDQWQEMRAKRVAGASYREIAQQFGCDPTYVFQKSKAENWDDGRDSEALVRARLADKLNGVVHELDPVKKAEALDAEANRRAEIIRRHREEPHHARERVYAGLKAHREAKAKEEKSLAFDDLKAAKIASEALQIIQSMERKAWGLDTQATGPEDGPPSGRFRFVTGSIEIG